ncbi:MAG TPA: hypothetical protein VL360_00955 [Gammaproteobacteria bacterium]|jgi:hypothetical protein|nr:hypothetical protein [Gammaproteobacteria bacterium]
MTEWVDVIGCMAAVLVALTFYMKSMVALRSIAIASNICFIAYAYYADPILYPILYLHLFLFPLNSYRLFFLIFKFH